MIINYKTVDYGIRNIHVQILHCNIWAADRGWSLCSV